MKNFSMIEGYYRENEKISYRQGEDIDNVCNRLRMCIENIERISRN